MKVGWGQCEGVKVGCARSCVRNYLWSVEGTCIISTSDIVDNPITYNPVGNVRGGGGQDAMAPALGVLEAASVSVVPGETLVKGYSCAAAADGTASSSVAAASVSAAASDTCTATAASSSSAPQPEGSSPSGAQWPKNSESASGACSTARGVGAGDDVRRGLAPEDGDDSGPEEAEIRAAAASFETLVGGGAWGPLGDPLGPGSYCNSRILWQQRAFTWASSTLADQATEVLTAKIVIPCTCDPLHLLFTAC